MATTTHYAAIQTATHTIYGVGESRDRDRARDDAVEHGATCTCADDDADCRHVYGDLPEGFSVVSITPAAYEHVREHGGAPSRELSVSHLGVCLRSEE